MPFKLGRPTLKDPGAGLINGVVSVPDGLASAALAGVNPIYGLYTSIVAALFGSLAVSTQRMMIAATSASAITAGEALAHFAPETRAEAMFLLTLLTGLAIMLGAALRVGRLIKYISQSVMTGLLLGIAVVLVLDQLGPLFGFVSDTAGKVGQTLDLVLNPARIDARTAAIGLGALGIALLINRTRWRNWASLAAIAIPTAVLLVLGWDSVRTVGDVAPIAGGLPPISLPNFALLDADLVFAAVTLALIILIQGAGVSQTAHNVDGSPVNANQDILAQGVANTAAGLLSGIPAGGSVGQTALNVEVGAQTRWAGVFSGVWVLVLLVALPGVISLVPMTVLAALMIIAGFSALDFREARALWSVGALPRIVAGATFIACLFVSIAAAVAVGVLLSVVLAMSNAARDVKLVRIESEGHNFIETAVPARIDRNSPVVVLDIHGSLFFAGARSLQEKLPQIGDVENPVVVLRMRGVVRAGATLVDVLDDYADALAAAGGQLYLSGLNEELARQLKASLRLQDGDDPEFVLAQPALGAATRKALHAAYRWRSAQQESRD